MSKSALELRDNNVHIIDIAYKYGFESVDGYQRTFFKEFTTNPYDYSRNPQSITLFIPYKLYDKKEKNMEKTNNVFISVISKPAHKGIIKRCLKTDSYWDYSNEVGCDVWAC